MLINNLASTRMACRISLPLRVVCIDWEDYAKKCLDDIDPGYFGTATCYLYTSQVLRSRKRASEAAGGRLMSAYCRLEVRLMVVLYRLDCLFHGSVH
jgi:hypothetical protein